MRSSRRGCLGEFGVHFGLIFEDFGLSLTFHVLKKREIGLFHEGLDLEDAHFDVLEVLHHHRHEFSLRFPVESGRVQCFFLDDPVIEQKRVFLVGLVPASVLPEEPAVGLLGHGDQFLFEVGAPGDPILLLFLDVLNRHIRSIIQKGHESLHKFLAKHSGLDAALPVDLLVDEALGAESLARLHVEHLLGAAVDRAER